MKKNTDIPSSAASNLRHHHTMSCHSTLHSVLIRKLLHSRTNINTHTTMKSSKVSSSAVNKENCLRVDCANISVFDVRTTASHTLPRCFLKQEHSAKLNRSNGKDRNLPTLCCSKVTLAACCKSGWWSPSLVEGVVACDTTLLWTHLRKFPALGGFVRAVGHVGRPRVNELVHTTNHRIHDVFSAEKRGQMCQLRFRPVMQRDRGWGSQLCQLVKGCWCRKGPVRCEHTWNAGSCQSVRACLPQTWEDRGQALMPFEQFDRTLTDTLQNKTSDMHMMNPSDVDNYTVLPRGSEPQ